MCSPALKPFHSEVRCPRGRWWLCFIRSMLLAPSLSSAFSAISASYRRADNLLASSCTPALSATLPHHTEIHHVRLSRAFASARLLARSLAFVNFIDLFVPLPTRPTRIASADTSVLPPTRSSPYLHIIYFVAISRDVENHIARLVTRLQLLNYAAIICLFPRLTLSRSFSQRCLSSPQLPCQRVATFFASSMPRVTMNFMR